MERNYQIEIMNLVACTSENFASFNPQDVAILKKQKAGIILYLWVLTVTFKFTLDRNPVTLPKIFFPAACSVASYS
jgi:hypothetical protein